MGRDHKAAKKLGIEWHTTGDGFTWTSKDMDETAARARHGWEIAKEKIASDQYDLIVLDEFTYTMIYKWIDISETMEWLRLHRPLNLHLVITGRSAPDELIEQADLVTEMKVIKHPYEQGIVAQAGVEF